MAERNGFVGAAIGFSGTAGIAVIAVVVGEVVPISVGLAFAVPAVIVPPAALAQIWAMRRAWRSERELARFFDSTEALLAIGDCPVGCFAPVRRGTA